MTLKQLEVFVAIAELKSFSKGADKVGITQSTASQHMHGLENELGIRLFDRGRDGALLTGAGKLFLGRASTIIRDCLGSREAIQRFLTMDNVVLKVGASDISATFLIPELLGRFRNQHPKVLLDILQENSRSVVRLLLDEEIEVGIIGGIYEDERVTFHAVRDDSLVCAVSPLLHTAGKLSLSQAELCKVPLIVREDGSGTQKAVNDALSGTWINKDSLTIAARLRSSECIRRALLNGIGYAFISSCAIAEELSSGLLTAIRIPGVQITRKLYAIRREGRELSPAAAAFWELVVSTCSRS